MTSNRGYMTDGEHQLCEDCLSSLTGSTGQDVPPGSPSGFFAGTGDRRRGLLRAAEAGHRTCVKILLEGGADVNSQDEHNGNTALKLSAQNGHYECVEYLIKSGADVNLEHKYGDTALSLSSQRGHNKCVDVLIKAGADLNDVNVHAYFPAIELAAGEGHSECLKLLIDAGANVNLRNTFGNTALMTATEKGRDKCLELLINAGADVNVQHNGDTAVTRAAMYNYANCVELLIKAGADVNLGSGDRDYSSLALNHSTYAGNTKLVKLLITAGADVNVLPSPLIEAAYRGYSEIVEMLIHAGADVNAKNRKGETPLLIAVERRFLVCIKLLVKTGADVNVKDQYGRPILIMVITSSIDQKFELVKLIVEAGVKVNTNDRDGNTAIISAAKCQCCDIVNFLIEAGSDVNMKDSKGNTALIYAATRGSRSYDSVKALVEAGADVNARDARGDTVLAHAGYYRHSPCPVALRCVELLIKAGADFSFDWKRTTYSCFGNGYVEIFLSAGATVNLVHENGEAIYPSNSVRDDLIQLIYVGGGNIGDGREAVKGSLTQTKPGTVPCLSYLCRDAVRNHLLHLHPRVNLFVSVPQIGLPAALENFLLYDRTIDSIRKQFL